MGWGCHPSSLDIDIPTRQKMDGPRPTNDARADGEAGQDDVTSEANDAILKVFTDLQRAHCELRTKYETVRHEAESKKSEAVDASKREAFWREEAGRLAKLSSAKELTIGTLASAAVLQRETSDAAPGIADTADAERRQLREAEQRLEQANGEIEAMRATCEAYAELRGRVTSLETELRDAKAESRTAAAEVVPLRAQLAEAKRKSNELRGQVGRLEIDKQRKLSELQAELSATAKKYKAAKNQLSQRDLELAQPATTLLRPSGMALGFRPPPTGFGGALPDPVFARGR